MPEPPKKENKGLSWPDWPMKLYTSSSQEEGCDRDWSIATKAFEGRDGHVTRLKGIGLDWLDGKMTEVAGSEFDLPADLVLLAMGFVNPVHEGMLDGLGVSYDDRGNVAADTENYRTSIETDDPDALTRRYAYYDPIYTLPETGQAYCRAEAART